MRTVSRCRPNTRDASRTLIPSTITARRTRRYTSTLYIHRTIRRVDYDPMNGGGRSIYNRRMSAITRRTAHFTSAVYSVHCGREAVQSLASTEVPEQCPFCHKDWEMSLPGGNRGDHWQLLRAMQSLLRTDTPRMNIRFEIDGSDIIPPLGMDCTNRRNHGKD